jgi:hypothetical protein
MKIIGILFLIISFLVFSPSCSKKNVKEPAATESENFANTIDSGEDLGPDSSFEINDKDSEEDADPYKLEE